MGKFARNAALGPIWKELFPQSDQAPLRAWELRSVSFPGKFDLAVPLTRARGLAALDLYPAQTRLARIFKAAAELQIRLNLAWPFPKQTLLISPQDSIIAFLAALSSKSAAVSPPAIYTGKTAGPCRRFIFLIFDRRDAPRTIVKAARQPAGRALIRREIDVLRSASERAGVPRLIDSMQEETGAAFAIEFASGQTPFTLNGSELAGFLTKWIHLDRLRSFSDLPIFQRTESACLGAECWPHLARRLTGRQFHPVLQHGDFAPWNLKREAMTLRAFDWESGETEGIPGWDWFHFVTQTTLLVQRGTGSLLARKLKEVLASAEFCEYAAQASVDSFLPELLLLFLLHYARVLRPASWTEPAEKALASLIPWAMNEARQRAG